MIMLWKYYFNITSNITALDQLLIFIHKFTHSHIYTFTHLHILHTQHLETEISLSLNRQLILFTKYWVKLKLHVTVN